MHVKRIVLLVLTALMLLELGGCQDAFIRPEDYQSKEKNTVVTGLVNATEVDVASKVPGRIMKTFVREGDMIKVGDKLVELRLDEINAKLAQAQSAIDAAKAQLRLANLGARPQEIKAAKEQFMAAQKQVGLAQKMYNRMSKLLADGALPQAKFDEVEFKYSVAKNQMEMAQAKYDALSKGARPDEIKALEALVSRGENTAKEIEVYLGENIQRAPISGEVSAVILHSGELANTGYPIVSIVDLDDIWASFALREDKLKDIRKGDVFEVYVPALDKSCKMYLYRIAALGDFATWKATSEHNSFDLKSFEVKLRPIQQLDGLRPGMTVRWDLSKPAVEHNYKVPSKSDDEPAHTAEIQDDAVPTTEQVASDTPNQDSVKQVPAKAENPGRVHHKKGK